MLRISGFSLAFESVKLFQDFSLTLAPGELCWLKGANGSGKTTLLNYLSGIIPHQIPAEFSGSANLDGTDLKNLPLCEVYRILWHAQSEPGLQFFFPTCETEIAFALENLGLDSAEMHLRVENALRTFGLDGCRFQAPNTLSYGQQKLLLCAIGQALDPKLLLLDEPLAGLSSQSLSLVLTWLRELKKQGKTVIVSEHDSAVQTLADIQIELKAGGPINDANPAPILSFSPLPASFSEPITPDPIPLINCNDLHFAFTKDRPMFHNLSFSLGASENILLRGENGCGKSTLLKLLIGLLNPLAGNILLRGKQVKELKAATFRCLFYQDQNSSANLLGISPSQNWLLWKLSLPALPDYPYPADPLFTELSSGQQKQAAQSILPFLTDKFWILDEPFSSLDDAAAAILLDLLRQKCHKKPGLLIVAHEELAGQLPFDQIWTLSEGKITREVNLQNQGNAG
jgi:energy-coupling factor transport system ATP-binding protein